MAPSSFVRRSPRATSTATSKSSSLNKMKRQTQASLVTPSPQKKVRSSPRKLSISNKAVTAVASLAAATSTSNNIAAALTTTSKRTDCFGVHVPSSNNVPVHTLLLGTHPSIRSLEEQQYFGHPMNAFWWIAGDCLGFRRAAGLNVKGEPFKFTQHVRYGQDDVIPYEEQVEMLTAKGFALWDVVKSCRRKGSLDCDIRQEEPNDLREFCQEYPTIQRIVFCNGSTQCILFNKHFKEWWNSGQLVPNDDDFSQRAFSKKYASIVKKRAKIKSGDGDDTVVTKEATITCICAIGVSPAAARYTYKEKRDFWEQHVYQPGLDDYQQSLASAAVKQD